jgi:hypothetical protein
MPFFLHNVIGIRRGDATGCARPWPCRTTARILLPPPPCPKASVVHCHEDHGGLQPCWPARHAASEALRALAGARPAAAFVFDCVATRLRMGRAFGTSSTPARACLEPAGFVGCEHLRADRARRRPVSAASTTALPSCVHLPQ